MGGGGGGLKSQHFLEQRKYEAQGQGLKPQKPPVGGV